MKNNRKDEIYKVLNGFKRILLINSDKIEDFSLNDKYFDDITKKLKDEEFNDMDELEANHSFIVEEFKNVILKYGINYNQIKKPVVNHIKECRAYNEIQKKIDERVMDCKYEDHSEDEDNSDTGSECELKEIAKKQLKKSS